MTEPTSIRYHLERAAHAALSGRPGPVWLDIPMDVQYAPVEFDELKGYVPPREPGGRTPILALTANTLVEDRYACFEAGMDGFLIKPLDREKLAEALAGLIASRHIAA